MTAETMTAWALVSWGPDLEPDIAAGSFAECVTAARWLVGVTNPWPVSPLWIDTILLGDDRFVIRPRVRVSPGATCWLNLDGWPGTPYERRWPVPVLDPVAFTEHVLTRPDDWMRDAERQDMRRILGGTARP